MQMQARGISAALIGTGTHKETDKKNMYVRRAFCRLDFYLRYALNIHIKTFQHVRVN